MGQLVAASSHFVLVQLGHGAPEPAHLNRGGRDRSVGNEIGRFRSTHTNNNPILRPMAFQSIVLKMLNCHKYCIGIGAFRLFCLKFLKCLFSLIKVIKVSKQCFFQYGSGSTHVKG